VVSAPPAHVDRRGEALYVTDGAGVRWRVHDVAFGPPDAAPGRRRRVPLGSSRATYRWFVSAEGAERCHRFERGESRELTSEKVARQLAAAGFTGRIPFDSSQRSPR
jgi:hypothetical protein